MRRKVYPQPDFDQLKLLPSLEFREEQDVILAKLVNSEFGVINAATGYGKTFLIVLLSLIYPESRIALVVPGRQLAKDAFKEFKKYIKDVGMLGAGENEQRRVTVVVDRSLCKLDLNNVDFLFFDEVHKAAAHDTAAVLSKGLWECRVFGFSATPEGRSDNADRVVEMIFGPVIHTVSYQTAQAANIVVPIIVKWIEVPGEGGPQISDKYQTPTSKQRWVYWRNQERNEAIVKAVREEPAKLGLADDVQILILVEKAEHAYALSKMLPEFTLVHGKLDSDREARLKKAKLIGEDWKGSSETDLSRFKDEFKSGKLNRVIATTMWGTGVDFPQLPVLVRADGSPAKISNQQWSGRVSRTAEGKTFGLIIDFMDSFDDWARERSKARMRIYTSQGWTNDLPNQGGDYRQGQLWTK